MSERPGRLLGELSRELRGIGGDERLVVLGVAVILISLPLPWYGVPVSGDLVQTGLAAFTFAEAAILATCAATVYLAMRVGGGYVPPKPLREWALFVLAGVWIALILLYRMLERPDVSLDIEIVSGRRTYSLGYGIFVAMAGAGLIVAAGLRHRAKGLDP
ncbi:MAG: hypothetical protein M3O25_05295 [Actinomycetota bacterium]|nr:hypothetical protein [Actinomycetota bacterium]